MNIIYEHNPWWKGEKDFHIEKWEEMRIKWRPDWINKISLKPHSLNFVIGPRQIGKTTGLKILIEELAKKHKENKIFYFNCDFVPDIKTFQNIIDEIINLKKDFGHTGAFIFLDEVTNVNEWWRIIKGYSDLGKFKNDVLTISGSSSLTLKKNVELFPGRRGNGKDIYIGPLLFREYLQVHGLKLQITGNRDKDIAHARLHKEKIQDLFKKYLVSGGFPPSINKDKRAVEYFLKAIENELVKNEKNLNLIREIIISLFRKCPSPLNYSTIAKDTSGYSYKTVDDYLETLKNIFILDFAYFKDNKKVIYRKEKKIFFIDPFIANCFSSLYNEEYLKSALFEWIVQSHLIRHYNEIYYFRNSYEIDCISKNLKIEVKVEKPHKKYPTDVIILNKEDLPYFLASL